MDCVICKNGLTHPGDVTVTLTRDESTIKVIIKNLFTVPLNTP